MFRLIITVLFLSVLSVSCGNEDNVESHDLKLIDVLENDGKLVYTCKGVQGQYFIGGGLFFCFSEVNDFMIVKAKAGLGVGGRAHYHFRMHCQEAVTSKTPISLHLGVSGLEVSLLHGYSQFEAHGNHFWNNCKIFELLAGNIGALINIFSGTLSINLSLNNR